MSNSISANDTANRSIAAIKSCRVGYTHVADYISPRRFYNCFSASDDFMAMQLIALDQARIRAENMVRYLMRTHLWRGRIKQIAQVIYSTRKDITTPIPICRSMLNGIIGNMTEDEQDAYATMADGMDKAISDDIFKLDNSIRLCVNLLDCPNKVELSEVLSCHIFSLMCKNILDRCLTVQGGSLYYLCIDPFSPESRARAYRVESRDLDRLMDVDQRLISELCQGRKISVPYTKDMENGMTIIIRKVTNIITIYNCCKDSGIDVFANCGKHDIADRIAAIEQLRREQESLDLRTTTPAARQPLSRDDLQTLFTQKGWKAV